MTLATAAAVLGGPLFYHRIPLFKMLNLVQQLARVSSAKHTSHGVKIVPSFQPLGWWGLRKCTLIGHLVSPGNKVTVTGMSQAGSDVYPKGCTLCGDVCLGPNLPSAPYWLCHLGQVT